MSRPDGIHSIIISEISQKWLSYKRVHKEKSALSPFLALQTSLARGELFATQNIPSFVGHSDHSFERTQAL